MADTSPAVVAVAKERAGRGAEIMLSTGVRARLIPVAASLVDEVTACVEMPRPPMWHNSEKDREEPNPGDPEYLRALERANHDRGIAAIDAIIMFGVELVDGLPEDDGWVRRLKFLGIAFNADDPFEKEFAYKKYVAVGAEDLSMIMSLSGLSQAEVSAQAGQFQRPA